jgi:hypothetical protein
MSCVAQMAPWMQYCASVAETNFLGANCVSTCFSHSAFIPLLKKYSQLRFLISVWLLIYFFKAKKVDVWLKLFNYLIFTIKVCFYFRSVIVMFVPVCPAVSIWQSWGWVGPWTHSRTWDLVETRTVLFGCTAFTPVRDCSWLLKMGSWFLGGTVF